MAQRAVSAMRGHVVPVVIRPVNTIAVYASVVAVAGVTMPVVGVGGRR